MPCNGCHNHIGKLNVTKLKTCLCKRARFIYSALADGTAKAFRLNIHVPEIVSVFNDMPWHNNSVLLGDLAGKIAKDNSIFDLHTTGKLEPA